MKFVEEVVVEEFLPTYRSMLAERLRDRGLTQREVADALGISQSAVSKYAHGDVTRRREVAEDDRVVETVEELAEGLATGDVSRVQALVESEVLIRRLEADLLGRLHEEAMPELAAHEGTVRIHDPGGELRARERVRAELRRGLRRLENASGVAGLIPNVGSNLVACLPDAAGIDDVAGVPGRIVDVKGRPMVPGEPEFGTSEHVAGILLAARKAGSDAEAAMNVRYDESVVDALSAAGLSIAEFDADADLDDAVAEALTDARGVDVLYHTGGYGVEPIVYVLGPDVEAVVDRVRELL
ncbi:DNA-binding protein [Halobacteriales archaeon QS_8_69_26]|nr:MAG: DNA-binding protein [Halobacteriales archaeon QS_8_69_26]